MTEFRALNNYARATGEGLQEKVDMAMTSEILRMRFAHFMEEFTDDEGFLQATLRYGLQVERMKALEKARERTKPGRPEEKKKDDRKTDGRKLTEKARREPRNDTGARNEYGGTGRWSSEAAAFEGVPVSEKRELMSTRGCHRCGRGHHRAAQCFAGTTAKGTSLPPAPWKVAGVTEGLKRKRAEEPKEISAPKLQNLAAIDTMEDVRTLPLWADNSEEESDF